MSEYPSYEGALEAAGIKVHQFKRFGSYQGDWWAQVTMPDGRKGWINGVYGSCSVCDALEAHFGWDHETDPDFAKKYAEFGQGYLDSFLTQEEAEKEAAANISWDLDADDMVKFIKKNAV